MTKLLFCAECGDVVAPSHVDKQPRFCRCQRHAVWWDDGSKGHVRVIDTWVPHRSSSLGAKAWIIGIHNGLLTEGGITCDAGNGQTTAAQVAALLDDTPDTYLFKRANSLVIRFTPGSTGDSNWASSLPGADGAMPVY